LRDVLFHAAGWVKQSRNLQSKPREKAGGRCAGERFLHLPAGGSGSASISALSAKANEEQAAVNLAVSID
jgi:hypothetical protein